ncbi:hypothetical protein Hanom_Chr06g00508851 [Helianthus anomalus]
MNVQSIEGVEVDFENLRGIAYNNTPVDANPNQRPIPEEIQKALWFRKLPPDLTQKKRFERTQGEFSGQIRNLDWDE